MKVMRILETVENLTDRLAHWLEEHPAWFLSGFSVVYFVITIWLAAAKPFWFDELFTYYLARLPSVSDIWSALRQSADQQPPPFFLVTRASGTLLSDAQVAFRLPEMLGYWLASVCVFHWVRRRSSALYGAVALSSLLITGAYEYAYEARPYALVLGFCALCLLSWQAAADGRWRRLSLAGVALSIAAAISSSYYAVLIVPPLALAELVRTLYRKVVDWAMWISLAAGASVAFLYLPLVASNVRGFSRTNWASPYSTVVIDIYRQLLGDTMLALLALLVLAAVYLTFRRPRPSGQSSKLAAAPGPHEMTAAAGLLLLPFLLYIAGVLVTHMVTGRYALSAAIGFSLVLTFLVHRAARGNSVIGTALLLSCLAVFACGPALRGHFAARQQQHSLRILGVLLAGQPSHLPVVVDDPHKLLELAHYENPEIAARLFYMIEPESALRYQSVPYPATRWLKLRNWLPLRPERLALFRKTHQQFLLYVTGSPNGWVLPKLVADGATIQVAAVQGRHSLYLVND
jgi:hypothetical protein